MKFVAVTTYAQRHWEEHARRCVETFRQHWSPDIPLVQYDDAHLESLSPWLADFKARHKHRPTADYRMDAVRFSHKVAAIELAAALAVKEGKDVLIWMDADCVTHAPVNGEWLEKLLKDGDFAYLRRATKYPEMGFALFRLNPRGKAFIEKIVAQYRDDKLFAMSEWHDSFVIDQVRESLEKTGMLRCVSLSGGQEHTHHPLINGPLGERLDHLKGPRKQQGHSHGRDLMVTRTEGYWQKIPHGSAANAKARQRAATLARERLRQKSGSK